MRVLTRYLLRAHLGPLAFALVALTGLLVLNTVARDLALLHGKGIPGRVILEYLLLSLPPALALTLPMSVLVAVLYTVSQMAAENEITALKASGVDLRRAALPLVACAALIAGGMVWFNDRVLPATNHRLTLLTLDLMRASPLLAFREQTVNPIRTEEGPVYLRARHIEAGSGRMRDVVIHDPREPTVSQTIHADSGRMALDGARSALVLSLYHGQVSRVDFTQPQQFEHIDFLRYHLRFGGVARRLERSDGEVPRHDRSMTLGMMRARIDTLRTQVARTSPEAGGREAALRREIRMYQVEIHKKYSIAAATLVFVLIGIPLALRFPRGGAGMVIAVSLPVFALYYVGLEVGEPLADAGRLPPALAMWIVNLAMAAGGMLGLARVGREQGTTRGGGLPRWPWRGRVR